MENIKYEVIKLSFIVSFLEKSSRYFTVKSKIQPNQKFSDSYFPKFNEYNKRENKYIIMKNLNNLKFHGKEE